MNVIPAICGEKSRTKTGIFFNIFYTFRDDAQDAERGFPSKCKTFEMILLRKSEVKRSSCFSTDLTISTE